MHTITLTSLSLYIQHGSACHGWAGGRDRPSQDSNERVKVSILLIKVNNWVVVILHLAMHPPGRRMHSICGACAMSRRGKAGYVCVLHGDACTLAQLVEYQVGIDLAIVRAHCACPNYPNIHFWNTTRKEEIYNSKYHSTFLYMYFMLGPC